MELLLQRNKSGEKSTISPLRLNGLYECLILEDVVREIPGEPVGKWKIKGQTAIPAGRYQIVLTFSPRFKRILPEIVGVSGFTGIRIHAGNRAEDTEGCLIPGTSQAGEEVRESRVAFDRLMYKLQAAWKAGEPIFISVQNHMDTPVGFGIVED